MRKKKIVICGWYGAGNLGDELILATALAWIKESGGEPIVLSFSPAYTKNTHNVDAIDILNFEKVSELIRVTDLLIIGGGGLFQTIHSFTYEGLYNPNKYDISSYLRPALLAFEYSCPVVMWAQGIGPLITSESRHIISQIFNRVKFISVRDQESYSLLKEINVENEIIIAPDPVWSLDIREPSQSSSSVINVVLAIRPWGFDDDWHNKFIRAIKESCPSENVNIIWLPFQPYDVPNRSESDLPFIYSLAKQLGPEYNQDVRVVNDFDEAIDIMNSADCIIAMRLHAQILGIKCKKPTLCIEYDAKMSIQSENVFLDNKFRLKLDDNQNIWNEKIACLLKENKTSVSDEVISKLKIESQIHKNIIIDAVGDSREWNKKIPDRDWLSIWRSSDLNQKSNEIKNLILEIKSTDNEILSKASAILVDLAAFNKTINENNNIINKKIDSLYEKYEEMRVKENDIVCSIVFKIFGKKFAFEIKKRKL